MPRSVPGSNFASAFNVNTPPPRYERSIVPLTHSPPVVKRRCRNDFRQIRSSSSILRPLVSASLRLYSPVSESRRGSSSWSPLTNSNGAFNFEIMTRIPRLPSCSQVLGSFGVFRRIFQVNFRGWQRRPFSAREIAIFEDLDICRSLQCSWKINLSFCARILHRTFHGSFSNKGSSNRKLWIRERKIYSICFMAKLSSKERDCGRVTEILGKFCFYLKQKLVHFQ